MTRRQFFTRVAAAFGAAAVAPALLPPAEATVWQAQRVGPFTMNSIPLVADDFMRQDFILFCSPQVKTAYEDLVRSDQAFWRSQR
jgi:hypothetical protein